MAHQRPAAPTADRRCRERERVRRLLRRMVADGLRVERLLVEHSAGARRRRAGIDKRSRR